MDYHNYLETNVPTSSRLRGITAPRRQIRSDHYGSELITTPAHDTYRFVQMSPIINARPLQHGTFAPFEGKFLILDKLIIEEN